MLIKLVSTDSSTPPYDAEGRLGQNANTTINISGILGMTKRGLAS